MRRFRSTHLLLSSVAAMALATPVSAAAQDAPAVEDDGPLSEIVVTAEKRGKNLQEVPIAISAVQSEELELRGLTEAKDLSAIAPNVAVAARPPTPPPRSFPSAVSPPPPTRPRASTARSGFMSMASTWRGLPPRSFGTQVVNAGKTIYTGAEVEARLAITDQFTADGSFGYVHKNVKQFPGADVTGRSATSPMSSPPDTRPTTPPTPGWLM